MTVDTDGSRLNGWLRAAAQTPEMLSDSAYVALLGADGEELEALCELADAVRRERVGDTITFAVNRNLDPAIIAADPQLLAALVDEAWALGATEVCLQGPLVRDLPGGGYLDLIVAITARQPELHIHAYRAAELAEGASRLDLSPREFLIRARELGLGSVPGTAARILHDPIRSALTNGSDIPASRWIEVITTAHEVGLRSTATMVYGHLETPAQQIQHLRSLAAIQARTGGFTELILMPIQPEQVPPGISQAVRYASVRETRAVHAVARLMFAGSVDHIQAPWPKVGLDLTRRLLDGGADDIGGILLDGAVAPTAGPEAGNTLDLAAVERLAAGLGRGLGQRTTLYEEPSAERIRALRADRQVDPAQDAGVVHATE